MKFLKTIAIIIVAWAILIIIVGPTKTTTSGVDKRIKYDTAIKKCDWIREHYPEQQSKEQTHLCKKRAEWDYEKDDTP